MIHCLHGAVGSNRDWDGLGKLDLNTHAVNLWEFFETRTPSLEEAGQEISARATTGDVILGYSMGGRLALHALLARPEKWRAAIIVSAHPGLIDGHHDRLTSDLEWARRCRTNWTSFLRDWNDQAILNSKPSGMHQASERDRSSVSESFDHWSLGRQKNLCAQLAALTCPVLWITGARDSKFSSLASEACALIPNAQHQSFEDAGHRVPWEQPGQFAEAVRSFLSFGRTD